MDNELSRLTIKEVVLGYRKKEFKAKEVLLSHFVNMDNNKHLNAFITETRDLAIEKAEEADKQISKGDFKLLTGIPLAIKDNFCTKSVLTTAASKILSNFIPSYESTVTTKLFNEGGIMVGKTNLDEFAMGSANTHSYYGKVINCWKTKNGEEVVPGGSSGGSAVAVAANMAMAATGTDTGGSVRLPAAFCGLVGLKPTYGRCSRYGMVAFSSSLDQASIFNKTVEDSAIMLQAIVGHDPKDSTSSKVKIPDFSSAFNDLNIKGLKIGIPKEYKEGNLPEDIQQMWEKCCNLLKDAGAEIVDISLPHTHKGLGAYYIIAPAEASSNLARYDGIRYGLRIEPESGNIDDLYSKTRAEGFGHEVKRRIMIGTYVLSTGNYEETYLQAQKVRALIVDDFKQAFNKIDIILTPTSISEAFSFSKDLSPIEMYKNDIFTIPASLAGLPAMSVPAGISKNSLPLGIQIIANSFDEITMLKTAKVLELAIQFNKLKV